MSVTINWAKWRERLGGSTVLISVLVHLLLGVLLWFSVVWTPPISDPPAVDVEVVPAAQAPPPPQLQQQPAPEPAPKPPQPKPQRQAQSPPPDLKPGPKPVLEPGKLDKDSNAGKHNWLDDVDKGEATKQSSASLSSAGPTTEAMSLSKGHGREEPGGEATQSERDLLLGQILLKWKHPPGDWPPDSVIGLRVRVQADGYLAPPFDARTPYSPSQAITGYDTMRRRGDPRLAILETLYIAIRVAQPLMLPPELRAKAPFTTVLDFRLDDID